MAAPPYFIPPPARRKGCSGATGTPVAPHCVKSLRSACLIRLPYQTRPVRHRSCKLPQDLRRTAFPLSTRHNKHYVYFTQCSAPFAPSAASTALPPPPLKKEEDPFYMPAAAGRLLRLKKKNRISLNIGKIYHTTSNSSFTCWRLYQEGIVP